MYVDDTAPLSALNAIPSKYLFGVYMKFPKFRTVIEAVMKPPIKALRCFYDLQVKTMLDRVAKQDEVLRDTQEMVVKLNTNILKLLWSKKLNYNKTGLVHT